MSTRANIIIQDKYNKLYFYRHSDGYPEGVEKTLQKFLNWLKEGRIRADAMQAAGWLIIIGNEEYEVGYEPKDWKVGAYEPTSEIHGDVDYIYSIDVEKKIIEYTKNNGDINWKLFLE